LTYSSVGVNRTTREKLRKSLSLSLQRESAKYEIGNPLQLPFGLVFSPFPKFETFIDFQIEVVGTKTLLAELDPTGYSTIGIDGVAMVVNDVIRSGAKPLFLSDGINIANSNGNFVRQIVSGVMKGAEICGATVTSGETGDAAELLHSKPAGTKSEPFDLFVSCCGFGERKHLIMGGVKEGDEIIGMESSGIHSNGITLARKVLLSDWGGSYDPFDVPDGLDRPIVKELLEPTRIYSAAINSVSNEVPLRAALHVTGDGFAKFHRLSSFNQTITNGPWAGSGGPGFLFDELDEPEPIFRLIYDTAKKRSSPISIAEMYRTFNMGYGYAAIVDREDTDTALELFNKYHPSKRIGRVTGTGKVAIAGLREAERRTFTV
jgi:phosphoribosylformylglycinamidine cyclo-ligase